MLTGKLTEHSLKVQAYIRVLTRDGEVTKGEIEQLINSALQTIESIWNLDTSNVTSADRRGLSPVDAPCDPPLPPAFLNID